MTKGLQFQTKVFWWRINTAKQKDGLTSFLMLSVLEAKIFQYGFLEEHNVPVKSKLQHPSTPPGILPGREGIWSPLIGDGEFDR